VGARGYGLLPKPHPPFASLVEGGEPLAVEGVRKNTPSVSYADSSLSEGALVHP